MRFDAARAAAEIPVWLAGYLKQSGRQGFVIHITQSSAAATAAALLARAVGPEKVLGVFVQDKGESSAAATALCRHLGIRCKVYNSLPILEGFAAADPMSTAHARNNLLPRIRMTMLYAIAESNNLLVSGLCTQSERFVGSFTKWGDCCDINPLGSLTTDEVSILADYLHALPAGAAGAAIAEPSEKAGILYADVNEYIRTGRLDNDAVVKKIKKLHKNSLHKTRNIPIYNIQ